MPTKKRTGKAKAPELKVNDLPIESKEKLTGDADQNPKGGDTTSRSAATIKTFQIISAGK